jgi:hypothetical protein
MRHAARDEDRGAPGQRRTATNHTSRRAAREKFAVPSAVVGHRARPVVWRENGWVMKKIRKDAKPMKSPNDDKTVPVPSRLGFMKGQFDVPDDFDRMGDDEIAELFAGRRSPQRH